MLVIIIIIIVIMYCSVTKVWNKIRAAGIISTCDIMLKISLLFVQGLHASSSSYIKIMPPTPSI